MDLRWLLPTLLMPLCWNMSCAAPAPSAAPASHAATDRDDLAMQASWVLEGLAPLTTRAEMRAHLAAGFAERDLQLGAFEAPTLGDCIERVVDAAMDDRAHAGSAPTRPALGAAVREYLHARHWVAVHRVAGAASCLPSAR